MAGLFLLASGPFAGLLFFSYAWDKPGLLPTEGILSQVGINLLQLHLYYSFFAIVAGPALILYAFIRLVVIIVKKLKAHN